MLARATQWAAVALLTALGAVAQSQARKQTAVHVPRFEDYLVTDIFHGIPADPQLTTPAERLFRTRIRDGVTKGLGVMREGREQPGSNFAEHYIVIEWGCGSPCGMMAIVDAMKGKVYSPPISLKGFLLPPLPLKVPGDSDAFMPWVVQVEFRLNSDLMIVKANPDSSKGRDNYTHYFL
jgi:hypothetical protein